MTRIILGIKNTMKKKQMIIVYCVENDNLHKFKKMLVCSWAFVTKIDTGSKEHASNVTN